MTAMHHNTIYFLIKFTTSKNKGACFGKFPNFGVAAELHLHSIPPSETTRTLPTQLVGGHSFGGFVKCRDLTKGRNWENLQSMFCPRLLVGRRLGILTTILDPSHSVKLYHMTCQNMDFLGPNYTVSMFYGVDT